jgi:hypothetical protein
MHPSFQAWKIIFKMMGKIKPFVFIVVLVFFFTENHQDGKHKREQYIYSMALE